MTELKLTRHFAVDPQIVFDFVTKQENISKWWGHANMTIPKMNMNLDRKGPWGTTMISDEGNRFKLSGVVEKVDPPNSVEFTWGWHDDEDIRGHESRVRFEVKPDGQGGTEFAVIHTGLPNEEVAQNHNKGWTSALTNLEAALAKF